MEEIKYKVVYTRRKTLAISILPDASVILRVPYRTSHKTIEKLVDEKAEWILKHTQKLKAYIIKNPPRLYINGESHLYRGKEYELRIERSGRNFIRFGDDVIHVGAIHNNPDTIRKILYQGYRREANNIFPEVLKRILKEKESYAFRISALHIRRMKSRWGSCSGKGVITLNTELIKLQDMFLEYVIMHELCHLKHHNHGSHFYELLSEMVPDWHTIRKQLRSHMLS